MVAVQTSSEIGPDAVTVPRCVVSGRVIVDEIDGELALGGGGPQAVFGASVVSKGYPNDVAFLTNIGDDLEDELFVQMKRLHADCTGVRIIPGLKNPRFRVTYPIGDEPKYEKLSGFESWDRLVAERIAVEDRMWSADILHLLMERDGTQADLDLSMLWRERSQGLLSFEPIILPNEPDQVFRDALRYARECDIFSPDLFLAHRIASFAAGDLCADPVSLLENFWSRIGPKLITIRVGRKGSYLWYKDRPDTVAYIPIVPVETVDVTGAGNAYGGALACAYAWSRDPILAACYASAVGAATVTTRGIPPVSDTLKKWIDDKVQDLLANVQYIPSSQKLARI